ncbi:MAG: alpha/beta hydrolase [Vulcanimicrobiaceae bacterium]
MLAAPQSRPAASYEEACERVRALQALDDESILPQARTALLDYRARTPLAVVLLHGLTNHPGQYRAFAPLAHERGYTVFVPRMPGHGDVDRMTTRLKNLTAEQLLASATEAVDIACGLGERVCVLGISTSGLLCAYFAQYRRDVARAIPVNPVFSILNVPYGVTLLIEKIALLLPNMFMWWDPRIKEKQRPLTAYPRFPTHALMQSLRIGDDVYAQSRRAPPAAQSVWSITNKLDPAVNNDVTGEVVRAWRAMRPQAVGTFEFDDLPRNHDVIDPENPEARVDIVYPVLLDAIAATPSALIPS